MPVLSRLRPPRPSAEHPYAPAVKASNKTYKCPVCGKSRSSKHTLDDHKRTVHTKEFVRVCQVPDCNHPAHSSALLANHHRSKHPEWMYRCRLCLGKHKPVRSLASIVKHCRHHHPDVPFEDIIIHPVTPLPDPIPASNSSEGKTRQTEDDDTGDAHDAFDPEHPSDHPSTSALPPTIQTSATDTQPFTSEISGVVIPRASTFLDWFPHIAPSVSAASSEALDLDGSFASTSTPSLYSASTSQSSSKYSSNALPPSMSTFDASYLGSMAQTLFPGPTNTYPSFSATNQASWYPNIATAPTSSRDVSLLVPSVESEAVLNGQPGRIQSFPSKDICIDPQLLALSFPDPAAPLLPTVFSHNTASLTGGYPFAGEQATCDPFTGYKLGGSSSIQS